jgi:predicted PurR-regulated permease PerM
VRPGSARPLDARPAFPVVVPPHGRSHYGEVLFAFALVLGAAFAYQTAFILKPFVFALLVGIAADPLVGRLARQGLNRYLAALVVVLLGVGVLSLLVALVAPILADQVARLVEQGPDLVRRATVTLDSLAERFPAVGEYLSGHAIIAPALERIGNVFPLIGQVFGTVSKIGFDTVLVLFLLIFGLGQPEPIRAVFRRLPPDAAAPTAWRVIDRFTLQIQAWVVGLATAMLAIGLLTFVGLVVLDVPYAFAFAVLAGALNIVPYVGPLIAMVLPVVVTAADDPGKALLVGFLFLGIQQVENHVLTPLVMARAVDLHPVLIAFLALVMTYYLGLFGTFVAVPAAVLLVILYQEVYLPWAHPAGAGDAPPGPGAV